jgi:phosphatidylethanolamine/phosphatidyl-N-methylethanolamine N-methyltransferase
MIQFLSVAFRNMKTVGTVCPSSPMLSRALAEVMDAAPAPRRILEVGPGTGPVTRELLRRLSPGDELDIVELSPEFCEDLERKVLGPWRTNGGRPGAGRTRVTLHNAAIQDVSLEEASYDCVVCGLPFNNFEFDLVRSIMERMLELLKPGGELTYFGYVGAKTARRAMSDGAGRDNIDAIERLERDLQIAHSGTRRMVLANIPPAFVRRLRKP